MCVCFFRFQNKSNQQSFRNAFILSGQFPKQLQMYKPYIRSLHLGFVDGLKANSMYMYIVRVFALRGFFAIIFVFDLRMGKWCFE